MSRQFGRPVQVDADKVVQEMVDDADKWHEPVGSERAYMERIQELEAQVKQLTEHEHDDQLIDGWWTCNSCGRKERNNQADELDKKQKRLDAMTAAERQARAECRAVEAELTRLQIEHEQCPR